MFQLPRPKHFGCRLFQRFREPLFFVLPFLGLKTPWIQQPFEFDTLGLNDLEEEEKSTILWFGNHEISNPNCFPAEVRAVLYPTRPPAWIVTVPASLAWFKNSGFTTRD